MKKEGLTHLHLGPVTSMLKSVLRSCKLGLEKIKPCTFLENIFRKLDYFVLKKTFKLKVNVLVWKYM